MVREVSTARCETGAPMPQESAFEHCRVDALALDRRLRLDNVSRVGGSNARSEDFGAMRSAGRLRRVQAGSCRPIGRSIHWKKR